MDGVSLTGSQIFRIGVHGTVQAVGDFNGDGLADLIVRDPQSGHTSILLNRGVPRFVLSWSGDVSKDWVIPGLADIEGNRTPQLIWRDKATGQVAAWYLSGGVPSRAAIIGSANPSWVIKAFGDVNGTGRDAIVWQDSQTKKVGDLWRHRMEY